MLKNKLKFDDSTNGFAKKKIPTEISLYFSNYYL